LLAKEVFQHRKKKNKTRRKMSNRAPMRGGDDHNRRYESCDRNWDARRNLGGGRLKGGGESVTYFATTTSKAGKSAVAEEVDGGKLICNLSGKYKFLFSWSSGG
jgi:hypothetical protein